MFEITLSDALLDGVLMFDMRPDEIPVPAGDRLDTIVSEALSFELEDLVAEYAAAVPFADGRYLLGDALGEGAMGRVFRAYDVVARAEVAVNILHHGHLEDVSLVERFQAESALLERCAHPGVIALVGRGTDNPDRLPYYTMELMESSLQPWLGMPLRLERVVEWMRQACQAVSHAHAMGITHGDIKPSNMLLTAGGKALKLADFSLARVNAEQRESAGVTDDLRALGEVFYWLLAGRPPRMHSPPPSKAAGHPRACDTICERAAGERTDKRFASAAEMDAALEMLQRSIDQPGHKAWWLAVGAAATAVAVTAVAWGPSQSFLDSAETQANDGAIGQSHEALEPARSPEQATRLRPFVAGNDIRFFPVPGRQGVLLAATEIRRRDFEAFVKTLSPDEKWRLLPSVRQIELDNPDQLGRVWRDTCPLDDDAASGISWEAADAYCRWLTTSERAAGRLPDGAFFRLPWAVEWLTACGVDIAGFSNKPWPTEPWSPWGDEWPPPPEAGNFPGIEAAVDSRRPPNWPIINRRDAFPRVAPVASYPPNGAGFFDMLGNLSEWALDRPVLPERRRLARLVLGSNWMHMNSLERALEPAYDYEGSAVDGRGFRPALQFAPWETPFFHLTLHSVSDISDTAQLDQPGRPPKPISPGARVRVTWRAENHGGAAAAFIIRSNARTTENGGKTVYRGPYPGEPAGVGGAVNVPGRLAPGQAAFYSFDMDTSGWPIGEVHVSANLHEESPADTCLETSSPGAGLTWIPPDWWIDAFTLTEK